MPFGQTRLSGIQSTTSTGFSVNLPKTVGQNKGSLGEVCSSELSANIRQSHAVFKRHVQLADRRSCEIGHDNVYGDEFTAAFLDTVDQEVAEHDSFRARLRSWLAHMILNHRFEMCVGMIILSNFVVLALDTDARARRDNAAHGTSDRENAEATLQVIAVVHMVYLFAYTLECGVRMYVLRLEFFKYKWNIFDLVIVVVGIFAEILEGLEALDGLRTFRTIRMLRATRVLVSFDELYSLVSGLTHAMKALMWAGILMLMVLTMWSIIAVEYVKPLMPGVASNSGFGTCTWCATAFDNIFLSNLTFFQIISGDGWSHVARPLIEAHAWVAILFIGLIFSVVFGLLNLIVAVIVDSAVQAREADVMTMAARKDAARAAAWDCFNDMVGALDKDGNGEISFDELKEGLLGGVECGNLGAYLTTMGIELSDLDMVFQLLDVDGDGAVTHEEFTQQLYQMKTQELPITLCYVRNSVNQLEHELQKVSEEIQTKLDTMLDLHVEDVVGKDFVPEVASNDDSQSTVRSSILNIPQFSGKAEGRTSRCNNNLDPGDTGKQKQASRVSLFVGKQPPSLRIPKTLEKTRLSHASTMPATALGNSVSSPKAQSKSRKRVADSNVQFTDLPGISVIEPVT